MNANTMRDQFERWFSDDGASPKAIERHGDGYRLMSAQTSWIVWQASWRSCLAFINANGS